MDQGDSFASRAEVTPPRGAQAISNPSKVAIGGAGAGCSTPSGGFRCLRESGGTSGGGTARCGGGGGGDGGGGGGSVWRACGRPKKGAGGTGTGRGFDGRRRRR